MEHLDEKIIEMMNEIESEPGEETLHPGIQRGFVKIAGETYEFEEMSILEDKIRIRLPKKFEIMSPEIAEIKYPSGRRPNPIFTNESTSINIAFNHTKNNLSPDDIESFKSTTVEILQKSQPAAKWLQDGVTEVGGKKTGFCEFVVPVIDCSVYNLMFFTELEERVLLVVFNCTEEEMEDWKPIAWGMLYSMQFSV